MLALAEPKSDGKTVATSFQLMEAYNYYNAHGTEQMAAETLGTDINTAKRFLTLAWTEKLVKNGFLLDTTATATLDRMRTDLKEFQDKEAAEQAVTPVLKPNLQEALKQKSLNLLGDIEVQMDKLLHDPEAATFNWYAFFQTLEIKPAHVSYILTEIETAKKFLEKPEAFDPVVADLKRLSSNKVATRAPIKRKVIKADKVVGQLQFLKRSDEFKLESINPEAILGAEGLWVFNIKYRDLIYYKGSGGMSVNGTTLKNVDLEQSGRRVLRKPMELLPKFLDATKPGRQKLFAGINSKMCKVSARLNKDCVLLKVEK